MKPHGKHGVDASCNSYTMPLMVLQCVTQLAEYKKRLDEELSSSSAAEEYKKKIAHDVEVLQEKVNTLLDTNDKLNKSKKKLMSEVSAIIILLCLFFTNFIFLIFVAMAPIFSCICISVVRLRS